MVAQLAHVAWGALLIDSLAARLSLKISLFLVCGFFIAKEVIESTAGVWEPVQSWSSGFEDMLFWTIGIVIGLLLLKYVWKRKI